jgi:hypothetical protein
LSSPERGERENGSRLSKKRNGYSHLGNGDVDGGGEKDPFRDPEDVKMRMNSFSGTHGKPALKRSPSSIQKTINAAKDYVKAKNVRLSPFLTSPQRYTNLSVLAFTVLFLFLSETHFWPAWRSVRC